MRIIWAQDHVEFFWRSIHQGYKTRYHAVTTRDLVEQYPRNKQSAQNQQYDLDNVC